MWRSILLASVAAAALAIATAPAEAGKGNDKSNNGRGHSASKSHGAERGANHGAQVSTAAKALRERAHPSVDDGTPGRREGTPDPALSQLLDTAQKFRED
ncbi:MAG: hypothetical protein HQL41_17215 [Alphaproteobacteria bacterium]|nr:hypothetical protein [Alphaproteobacteria bacterium]